MSNEEEKLCCSFCDKSHLQVKKLITGNGVQICNECVALCDSIIISEQEDEEGDKSKSSLTPQEIFENLNQYVIGQENAKKSIAVAVYNHYKRLKANEASEIKINKSNVLIIGPTGSGKTLLAEVISEMLDVPFAVADATTITESGYVGEDVEMIIKKLLQKSDFDPKRAERGIVYIDEIDKLSRGSENRSTTRDVGGEGVQQALLKVIEGTVVSVPSEGNRKVPGGAMIDVDTKNILFICGGSFAGIEKILDKEKNDSGIGFGQNVKSKESIQGVSDRLSHVTNDTLSKFGLIPELIGRLPVKVALDELSKEQLVEVLLNTKNSIVDQYKYLLKLDDVELEFEKDAILQIAETSTKNKTGARGLTAIMEETLKEVMFTAPSESNLKKITITSESVNKISPPVKEYHAA
ncbi:ATP-dependent Clp protease ATP-binding subunit ClpX [Psychromonas sp. SP041]|uniref:ATP-dependent Clp protease ATP-binding subunit ClpX n=1 Tax=Psychromonas sp. SP041 TaxID=1365007 RepID=UPI0010C787E4|nr:ATP-dependent Clp protease ATP-binding subunit ClpX [Psychromonas sp. SP041]